MPFAPDFTPEKKTSTLEIRKALEAIWRQTRVIATTESLARAGRFLVTALRDPQAAGAWLIFLDAFVRRHALGPARFDCIVKPFFNYAVYRLSISQRASILRCHYDLIGVRLPWLLAILWSESGVELGFLDGKHGEKYCLTLNPAGYCHKEGELSFTLSDMADGLELAKLTFLFIRRPDANGELALLIGGLQGPSSHCGPHAKARIVAATRALSGLRPKMAVFIAACAFARAMGAENLFAVSKWTHSINADAWWQRRKMYADYDGFWFERGGAPDVLGFKLPAKSQPRSQCKRRNEQRARVEALVDEFFFEFEPRGVSYFKRLSFNETCGLGSGAFALEPVPQQ